jgi:dipeptidyl aminopeptidase/acylaminoacyl peptidase
VRGLLPEDLRRQVALGDIALAPDGELVCYTRRTVAGDADRVALWLVPYRGGVPRRLTGGAGRDRAPRFSPDGRFVAFLSDRGGTNQLYVIAVDGGEALAVTGMARGVADFDWCPDGRRLVVAAEDERSPRVVGEGREGGPTARHITALGWRLDGAGLTVHDVHLHVVPARGGPPRRLTSGGWSAAHPRVSPDGTSVAFLADLDADADLRDLARLHAVAITGGAVQPLDGPDGAVSWFCFEADGGIVCHAKERSAAASADPSRAFRIDPGGGVTALTAADVGVGGDETSDLFDWATSSGADGRATWVAEDGFSPPVAAGTGRLADGCVTHAVATAGGRTVAIAAGPNEAPEVVALESGRLRRLTRESSWLRSRAWPALEVVDVDGAGGRIRSFVFSPASAEGPCATVLLLHGGPVLQWTAVPTIATLILTGAGYRVVTPNARGSAGRGRDWAHALAGRWGDVDAADCHAVLDHLVAGGLADPRRLGVTGLSYGGFLTNWLVGASDRFAAAVSENGVTNQVSAFGQCDVGPLLCAADGLGDTLSPAGVDALWRQSPLRNVAHIATPLLLLQGEADHRCPPGDNEQLFVALRRLGREVEYVLYPESSHLFSGTGRPDRRIDRQRRILDWFMRWMPA